MQGPICKVCGHDDHCRGDVTHAYHKNASQYIPSAFIHCTGKHCENPLCSCVNLVRDGKEFLAHIRGTVAASGRCTVYDYQLDLLGDGKIARLDVVSALKKKSKLHVDASRAGKYVFKVAA